MVFDGVWTPVPPQPGVGHSDFPREPRGMLLFRLVFQENRCRALEWPLLFVLQPSAIVRKKITIHCFLPFRNQGGVAMNPTGVRSTSIPFYTFFAFFAFFAY